MAIVSTFPEKRGLNTDDINDITNGEINNGFVQSQFNFSTEEQVVGKWIDGKPIYQRTFSVNTGSGGEVVYPLTGWNIDTVIFFTGVIEQIANGKKYYPSIFYQGDNTYKCNAFCAYEGRNGFVIAVGSGYYNFNAYITLQYTKITD